VEDDDGAVVRPGLGVDIDEPTVMIAQHDVRQARSDLRSGREAGVGLRRAARLMGMGL